MTDKIKEEVKKSDDGLAAKVRKLEETVKTVVATLERQFGIDLNRDGKIGLIAFCLTLSGLVAFGQTKIWNVLGTGDTDAIALYDNGVLALRTNAAPVTSVAATGTITAAAAVAITNGESVVVGNITYTFVYGTPAANQVEITRAGAVAGATNSITMSNLVAAINVPGVVAVPGAIGVVQLSTAPGYHGSIGNAIALSRAGVTGATGTNLTVTGSGTLTGGVDGTPGPKGAIRLHGTGLSFTTIESSAGHAVWTTK